MKKLIATLFGMLFFMTASAVDYSIVEDSEVKPRSILEDKPDYSLISQKQLNCLAKNVYFEANGTSKLDYELVTTSVLTRSKKYGKSPCKVIYQPYQYSWVGKKPTAAAQEKINNFVPVVEKIVKDWHAGKLKYQDIEFFHTHNVSPRYKYNPKVKLVVTTRAHRYYKMH